MDAPAKDGAWKEDDVRERREAAEGEARLTEHVIVWTDGLGGLCLRVADGPHAGDWRMRDEARLVVDDAVLYRLERRDSGEETLLTPDEAPWLEAPVMPVATCGHCAGPAPDGACLECR